MGCGVEGVELLVPGWEDLEEIEKGAEDGGE